jgi:hypothetical protein
MKEKMMAQPPKQGIPPAPPPAQGANPHPDPNAGKNIHGQPNRPDQSEADQAARDAEDRTLAQNRQTGQARVNIHGQHPQPNMAPPEESPKGRGDNTKAEMNAGKENLAQYAKRNDAEHEAGRHANESHQK